MPFVFRYFINYKTCAVITNSEGKRCCKLTAILPKKANVNISVALSVHFQQTNVQRSYFLLAAYRTLLKQQEVKKGSFKKN